MFVLLFFPFQVLHNMFTPQSPVSYIWQSAKQKIANICEVQLALYGLCFGEIRLMSLCQLARLGMKEAGDMDIVLMYMCVIIAVFIICTCILK